MCLKVYPYPTRRRAMAANKLKVFLSELLEHDNFMLLTHKRPDGDTIGSAVALCRALRAVGKTAFVKENPEITRRLLPYVQTLTAPDSFKEDITIAVDLPSYGQLPPAFFPYREKIDFLIDHHISNAVNANISSYINTKAAATGEIIFDMTELMDVKFDEKLAAALYISIATDTGCFLYSNTTSKTHSIAAKLLETGIDFPNINREFFEKRSRARIELERLIYNGMRFYLDGKVASIYISIKMRLRTGVDEDDIDDLSTLPRRVEGVVAGISAYEQKDGSIKMSVRTTEEVDASEVCAALGGGGHPRAAGCGMNGSARIAILRVVDEISKQIK